MYMGQVLVWNLADADGGALLTRADASASLQPDAGRASSRLQAQLRLKVCMSAHIVSQHDHEVRSEARG